MPQDERAQIDAILRRLTHKHAELPDDRVAAAVHHAYAQFDHSKLRDFVPLLVERRANDELARLTEDRLLDARLAHRGGAGEGTALDT